MTAALPPQPSPSPPPGPGPAGRSPSADPTGAAGAAATTPPTTPTSPGPVHPAAANPSAAGSPTPPAGPASPTDPAVLKSAFNAFKKRWKLTRLNDESKLGGGRPVTSGRPSSIAGIQPPMEFPREVWAELARQGRIKDMKGGFYAMP